MQTDYFVSTSKHIRAVINQDLIMEAYLENPIGTLEQDLTLLRGESYEFAKQEIIKTYSMAIHSDRFEPVDWGAFNKMIIDKLGSSVLIEIKEEAWKLFYKKHPKEKDPNKPTKGITNWICFVIGHSHKSGTNDSGYGICDRCQMHDYYDSDPEIRAWPRKWHYPFWGRTYYRARRAFRDFANWTKSLIPKRKSKREELDDLPF